MIKVSAPGKIHLSGEHSVVYGQPALLTAINKRTFIQIKKSQDELINIWDKKQKLKQSLIFSQIRRFSYINPQIWKTKDKLGLIKAGIDEIYSFLQLKPKTGFDLIVKSDIPLSSGLGSSAALAVSLAAAILAWEGKKPSLDLISQVSFNIEKRQHGNPSGGDNTTALYGGILQFKKQNHGFNFSKIRVKAGDIPRLFLVNSGRPQESTGEMVEKVKKMEAENKARVQAVVKDLGKTARLFINAFKAGKKDRLKDLIKQNQKLLEQLNVVGSRAKKIIKLIEKHEGAGKICGAGGIKAGSGMILAYSRNLDFLRPVLDREGLKYLDIKINEKGVKINYES
jgi:mevalonate kinase